MPDLTIEDLLKIQLEIEAANAHIYKAVQEMAALKLNPHAMRAEE